MYSTMKTSKLSLIVLACFTMQLVSSQEMELTSNDSIVQSSWMIGLGYNIVDDSGDVFDELFSIDEQWNVLPYPSRISIGKYFKNGLGIEAIGTYNTYKVGKTIDGVINTEEKDYLGIDARLTYDLNKLIGQTGWFDPYVGVGAGYTDANDLTRGTYNAIVGFRTWFSDRIGLDFSSSGKWSMDNVASNHLQHAAGVVYQFGIEKGLSKKGLEKLALLESLEKEHQKVQDSIAAAKKAEEETLALAEKLRKEKEASRLVAEEKAKSELYRKQLLEELNALDKVYYTFNSSYLSQADKTKLDELVVYMNSYPETIVEIRAHADARGTTNYNDWLSNRRAQRILEYIISKGIKESRVSSIGLGETQIINKCVDGVRCTEKEHRENRRTEYALK